MVINFIAKEIMYYRGKYQYGYYIHSDICTVNF